MFEFINKIFSPSTAKQETELNTVGKHPNQLQTIHGLLDELESALKLTPSTQLDDKLYTQIFNLIISTSHYQTKQLTRWQKISGSNVDEGFIREIKSARRSIGPYAHSKTADVESLLPFPTTEMLLKKVGDYRARNTVDGYDELMECADLYETRTVRLLSLSDDEKKELIGLLGTEDYAKKFEFALDQYVAHELKDKDSFDHYVGHMLTYTAVDFMRRVSSIYLPGSPPRSAPKEIEGAFPRRRIADVNMTFFDKNGLLVNLYETHKRSYDSYHVPFEENAFKKPSTKIMINLDKI